MCTRTLIWFAFSLCTSGPLAAQGLNVAVLGAEGTDYTLNDVEAKLEDTGQFNQVDQVQVYLDTPTLAVLNNYDTVLTWSNYDYNDSVALGNVLADFVDQGGGVVVMVFANSESNPNRRLRGRWESGGYNIYESPQGAILGQAELGTRYQPDHPLLGNVVSFDGGGSAFRSRSLSLVATAEVIADWTDGTPLVILDESHATPRVDLNFYPPSDESPSSSYWDADTDGGILMANALSWCAGGGVPELSFPDVIPGGYLTFHIGRVSPGNQVVTVLSSRGAGPTDTPYGILEVTLPWFQTPPFMADSQGVVDFTTTLPAGASGRTLYSQAVELIGDGTAELSNPVALPIP